MTLDQDFEAAAETLKTKVNKTLSDDELKEVYALYKQATSGDINNETSGGGGSAESAIALVAARTYTITVGAGGAGGSSGGGTGANGGDSSIAASGMTTITSIGNK